MSVVSKQHAFVRISKETPVATIGHSSLDVKYLEKLKDELQHTDRQDLLDLLWILMVSFLQNHEIDKVLIAVQKLVLELEDDIKFTQKYKLPLPEGLADAANSGIAVDPNEEDRKAEVLRLVLEKMSALYGSKDTHLMVEGLSTKGVWYEPRVAFFKALDAVTEDLIRRQN